MHRIFLILLFPVLAFAQVDENRELARQKYQGAMELIGAFQFDRALGLLSECYHQEPENIEYLLRIAYCNTQLGRFRDAKMFYNKILGLDSLHTPALSALGSIWEQEANYKAAQACYQKLIEIDSTNSYYFKRNGYMEIRHGRLLSAVVSFLRAHALNESDIEVIDQLCNLYLALNSLESVGTMLEKGLRLDPDNIKLLYNKARLHQKQKDHPTVIQSIERAMALGDTSDYYQMMLGVAYINVDSVDRAVFHLESIVAREKDSEHTHHYLGLAYRSKGNLKKSVEHFEKAVEKGVSSSIGAYHADLAMALEEDKQLKKAITHYQKAYEFSGDKKVLFQLARANDLYYKDKRMALRYYEEYLNSKHGEYFDYTQQRVRQLKEALHFQQ
jgi:tetratricopeptide (TPR) repeat protein